MKLGFLKHTALVVDSLILLLTVAASLSASSALAQSVPLTTLEYRVNGTGLQVSPAAVSVPKGIAGSVRVDLTGGDAVQQLADGGYVEAFLRGPGLPEPRRLVGPPNEPLLFPPLNLVGDYQLSGIRLVDAVTGETRMEGSPNLVPVRVFDEVLVSRVTSRPLTYDEIVEKGIYIDESNFRVVEFEAAFVIDGNTVPVRFPVVAPKFTESVELVPVAELEEKLAEAAVLNRQIGATAQLPKEFEVAQLNIEIQGINFEVVDPGEDEPLGLKVPPIPALMVIPGNIGFLNQFFSVQIFTENAAPSDSGLSVYNIDATLILPPGPDQVPASDYANPGDDPLRFARVGPDKIIQPVQRIVRPGPDGEVGTEDDIPRLRPGQSGQAEFLVEGLQEGLHVMDLDLIADMDGLAAGPVKVRGKAAGSVLVRNPKFSMAFSHPRTVRAGEPYDASVTILNTGVSAANQVQITLNENSLSGTQFEGEAQPSVNLGNLLPGESATATFRMRSLRTGAVSFSNITTSDDSVVGRFRLKMGVDERGVALSPDSIGMPDFVNRLPEELLAAANRVLGQALSVATAGQVPPGVLRVGKSTITRRVLDLAEAGQRLEYGDPAKRVLTDLLRDWEGGRDASNGFDQILRETEAGFEWREALFNAIEVSDELDAVARAAERAADLAGLGQEFVLTSSGSGEHWMEFLSSTNVVDADRSGRPFAFVYTGERGNWGTSKTDTNAVYHWKFPDAPAVGDIGVLLISTNGVARELRWTVDSPPADATYSFSLNDSMELLSVDLLSDGSVNSTIVPTIDLVDELAPEIIAVEQDLSVLAGRPSAPCVGRPYFNYGTIVAVVFSKPMTQESAGQPGAYLVDGDNGANAVAVQPGGRVAYLNLRNGISAIIPRMLTVDGVEDVRGNLVDPVTIPISSIEPGSENVPYTEGVVIKGRVLKGDGTPAVNVPVTLTMYDRVNTARSADCEPWIRRVSQVRTDGNGNFSFDFVMAGIPYSISATDTSGLSDEALNLVAANAAEGRVEREQILQLANNDATRTSLLSFLSAGTITEAIARVEGLDRALVRDTVSLGSGRIGQTVPIALRFRGRGTVLGQVVGADGVTPIGGAAVNLYPDRDSRELGRGIIADAEGRFAFYGVPLGIFSVEAITSDRRQRTIAGLLDTPGQVEAVIMDLPATPMPIGSLKGTVFDSDSITPHANARVFIGKYSAGQNSVTEVVKIVDADSEGNWIAKDIPAKRLDVVAVSFDGERKGVRAGISVTDNALSVVNVSLEATTEVFGKVQFEDGRPAANALVAGGATLVRTDEQGFFALEGVPLGRRTISAGVERDPDNGIDFPRLGNATLTVVPGSNNYVVVKLRAAGTIYGKVTDLNGDPIPRIRVAIPVTGGFLWTDADAAGNYVFENMTLGNYTLSAPSNVTAPKLNVNELTEQIRSGDEDKILAAFEEAVRVFVGADDPLITGEHLNFRPITWGFTNTRLTFDGQKVEANIRMFPEGTVSGRVLNHQGVPIGARVRLNGRGPAPNGEPKMTIRGERNSDPATGVFIFPGQLLVGPWTVQAASPFYPTVIKVEGRTTEIDPNVSGVELQFPPLQDFNGRLTGTVFNPDGTPAGENVRVKINFSDDYEILTDTNGFFDTQITLPARGYKIEAIDETSGLRGLVYYRLTAGITNVVEVPLLTRESSVTVNVLRGNGLPAPGAQVDLEHGSYPFEGRVTLFADENGQVTFNNLWEGKYGVCAQFTEAATRVFARGGVTVAAGSSGAVTLKLGATGRIEGTFVKLDGVTPVEGAQVTVGNLGFATTDFQGRFTFEGVPLGTHQLLTSDPVTGAYARATATVSYADETVTVVIIEGARGEVKGNVIDSYGTGFVAGATVTIRYSDGLTPSRTVTTGANGSFSFPGSPVGGFTLSAKDRPVSEGGRGTTGSANGVLNQNTLVSTVDVQLRPLGHLPVIVLREDGVTPASNVTVSLGGTQLDTDENGRVQFNNLFLGNYRLTAVSRAGGEMHSGGRVDAVVATPGLNPEATIRLLGVGAVSGVVLASNGVDPVSGAEVVIIFQSAIFNNQKVTSVTGGDGTFSFDDVPVGPYLVSASNVALARSVNGAISVADESDELTVILGDSGSVIGRLVRMDGVTPVAGIDVVTVFDSQSLNPGRAFVRSQGDGSFEFLNIPVGEFDLESSAAEFGGLIRAVGVLETNGQVLDLGDLRFDEDFPTVVSVEPPDTAIEVPTTVTVELVFSEELAASSVRTNGVFIRGVEGTVASEVELLEDLEGLDRVVHITPTVPLISEQTYEVIVLSGDLLNSGGGVVGSGPSDLVGRSLTVPFVSRFTTADNDPPVLLSLFPTNNAVQIDTRAVPRLSFNESLRLDGIHFEVNGPDGPVAGSPSVGVDGRVVSFVPTAFLKANAVYSMTVSNIFDLAGNRSLGEPFEATFATLDTVGPTIANIIIANGARPAAGSTIQVEAQLAAVEAGASVRFTQDFTPIGTSMRAPYRLPVTLPMAGTTTIRAIASDQYGNDGPFAELVIAVQANQPPSIALVRVEPESGPALSSQFVAVDVNAEDDSGIAELRVMTTGLGASGLVTTNAASYRVQGVVDAATGPGAEIEIIAEAIDNIGQSSGHRSLVIPIADGTAPTVVIQSPAEGAETGAGESLPIIVSFGDNFGVTGLTLQTTGAFETQQTETISPSIMEGTRELTLNIPPDAPDNGETLTVTVTSSDAAGNASVEAMVNLKMADRTAPEVVSVVPPDGADSVDINQTLEVVFTEKLNADTVVPEAFVLTVLGETDVLPVDVSVDQDGLTVKIDPVAALIPETSYELSLAPTLEDISGNALAAPFVSGFRTAAFRFVRPLLGTRLIEGQTVTLEVVSETITFVKARFFAAGTEVALIEAAPFTHNYLVPDLVTLPDGTIEFRAEALDGVDALLATATATVTVVGADEDSDGDGVSNADELARGTDPFTPNTPPTIDFPDEIEIIQNVMTEFAVTAADSDGNLVRFEVRESLNRASVKEFDVLRFAESLTQDYTLASSSDAALATLQIARRHLMEFELFLRVVDGDGFVAMHPFTMVVLSDIDGDGIPDRDDPDIDGDGIVNDEENVLGTNPLLADTDGDSISDGEEIAEGLDGFITNPLLKDSDGDLVEDGFEVALGIDPTNGADGSADVVIDGRTITFSGSTRIAGTLSLINSAVLSHHTQELRGEKRLEIEAASVVIDATSRIDVSARGFLGAQNGLNAASQRGRTLDNVPGSLRRNGGSYGGLGGFGSAELQQNYVYGSYRNPNEPGSGGGSDNGRGGSGGGLVRIAVESLVLDGSINANGGNGTTTWSGGGSGGGVNIVTGSLSGSGRITAIGGTGAGNAGGGGGGRIAIHADLIQEFDLSSVEAQGGSGRNVGTPGTIYIDQTGFTDELVVSGNADANIPAATPLLSLEGGNSEVVGPNFIVDLDACFEPGALIGMMLFPNSDVSRTYRIVGNTATRILTDAKDGSLSEVAASGDVYSVQFQIGDLVVQKGATIELLDADEMNPVRRGRLRAERVDIAEHARLAHPPATLVSEFGVELEVNGQLAVDETSVIDVSARGYLGGLLGENAANWNGRTLGNTVQGASRRRNGGSYGGLGGFGSAEQFVNNVYGFFRDPNENGSGGGSDNGSAGAGGGLVRITAGEIVLDGSILANGGNGTTTWSGGGSGGGVKILTDSISGLGAIKANGGTGAGNSGGGGGGRIALEYRSVVIDPFVAMEAKGGAGRVDGGVGSVFTKNGDGVPVIVIRSEGRESPLPEGLSGEEVIIDGAVVAGGIVNLTSLTLINGAVLTHPGADGGSESRLEITVGRLTIDETSRIDVSSRGYLGALRGDNAASETGRTLGNTTEGGSLRRNGGSYGGLGGFGSAEQFANEGYGSFRDPDELGSGGGSDSGVAGSGGGLVRINAELVELDGMILANGGNGSTTWSGAGSGGGVKVVAGDLTGTGSIHANGGNGAGNSGGGGGGRVAVYYDRVEGFDFARLTAVGGTGRASGGPGTIYTQQAGALATVVIQGDGRETPLPPALTDENLILDGATVSAIDLNVSSLTLINNAVLTHPGADTENEHRLEIQVEDLVIDSSSRIDVSTRGYLGGRGGSEHRGRTFGNLLEGGSLRRNGGSYGGLGGHGSAERFVNGTYGSFRDPNELGSGGGTDSGVAGNGGGLIRIDAQSMQIDGAILADGGPGSNTWSGGGSGGGIKVVSVSITGGGRISANGGNSAGNSGGGGGGRVALLFNDASGFDVGNITALGGINGRDHGTPGTIYLEHPDALLGHLIVDAAGANVPSNYTPFLSLDGGPGATIGPNSLFDENASFVPGSLVGLRLLPERSSSDSFRVVANTSDTILTDFSDGDMTLVVGGGDGYAAEFEVGRLDLRGGAKVELMNGDLFASDRRGRLHVADFNILEAAVLSHPAATGSSVFGLELIVDNTFLVQADSSINVDDRGFLGALRGDNAGSQIGRTIGNTVDGGSTRRNGGSYGGIGAFGSAGGSVAATYGDARNPDFPGSGGGSDSGAGGSGGGLIRITASALNIDGTISAVGGSGGSSWPGGGSGGGIRIVARDLSGSGSIQADGGAGFSNAGGGGGGRIAIYYEVLDGFSSDNVTVAGGVASGIGEAGTIVFEQSTFNPLAPLASPDAEAGFVGFTSVRIVSDDRLTAASGSPASPHGLLELRWSAPNPDEFVVEISEDLVTWTAQATDLLRVTPTERVSIVRTPPGGIAFFRLRDIDSRDP